MITTIRIIEGYRDFINILNDNRNFYDKMNGKNIRSNTPGKDLTFKCHNGVFIGVNIGETLSVGTLKEVASMTKDICEEVAQGLIDQGWAEDVS